MTPKEKAEELVNKFNYEDKNYLMGDAKQCALIAVDEFLYLQPFTTGKDLIDGAISDYIIRIFNYWKEVTKEIESYENKTIKKVKEKI